MASGFSAGCYVNGDGSEVVISYTGTNDVADMANWAIGLGLPMPQIFAAVDYYYACKAAYPEANITFTGHSLGGGLADAMLDRFTADLQKVAQEGGFTLTNAHITHTLVAFAMQFYYENPEASGSGKVLFSDVSGGIRFNRTDVAANLADAKGWQLYFQNYLAEALTLEEHQIVERLLPAATDWFIQAGSVSMSATADESKAFMVGGTGADWMIGGTEADLLIGNGGDDHLGGGKGNDVLIGGAGYDTYLINAGDGTDTILDSDGQGVVKFGDIAAQGSAGLEAGQWVRLDDDAWADQQNGIIYTRSMVDGETRLLIRQGDASVLVKGWSDGELGIELGVSVPAPLPVTTADNEGTAGQDFFYGTGDDDQHLHGNNDHLVGLAGIDYFSGLAGDDLIEGGEGNDVIAGGGGNDTLKGDDGDDLILGDGAVAVVNTSVAYVTQNNLLTGIQTTLDSDGFMHYSYDQPDNISGPVNNAYGGGADTIYAGAGNDVVEAGGGYSDGSGGDAMWKEAA